MKHLLPLVSLILVVGQGGTQDPVANPLAGKKFLSLEKLESGLSPNGVVLDHWQLDFKDKTFSWRYSDVGETGNYEYNPKTGVILANTRNRKLQANFDAKTGVLTWEKQKYKIPMKK